MEHTESGLCVPFSPPEDEKLEVQEGNVLRGKKGMSLEVTSIGFVGTNPESTPLPGVDYSKINRRYMKKNDTRLQLRLSLKEKEKIERGARRCGMSVSRYVRQCCLGREPRSRPPDVFWELLEELYAIAALLPITERERLSGLILRLQEAV